MKHIDGNNIVELEASSENANFPIEQVSDNHPKRVYKAEDGVTRATVTLGVTGGVDSIMLAGTNADGVSITVEDPNLVEWGNGDYWGLIDDYAESSYSFSDGFNEDYGWNSSMWEFSEGKAVITTPHLVGNAYSTMSSGSVGSFFEVAVYVSSYTAGSFRAALNVGQFGDYRTAVGAYYDLLKLTGGANIYLTADSSLDCEVDWIYSIPVTQLLSDPYFESGIVDWTDLSTGSSYLSWNSTNESLIFNTLSATEEAIGLISFSTDIGSVYQVQIKTGTFGIGSMNIGTSSTSSVYLGGSVVSIPDDSTITYSFRATTSTAYVRIRQINSISTGEIYSVAVTKTNNLVANGNFASTYNWTTYAGTTISGGEVSFDGTATENLLLYTNYSPIVSGNSYLVIYEVTNYVSGSIVANVTGSGSAEGDYVSALGWHTDFFTATSSGVFSFYTAASGFEGSIDNVTVYEMELVNGTWQPVGNVVVNPSFEGYVADSIYTPYQATLEASGGSMMIVATEDDTAAAYFSSPTTVGQMYKFSVDTTYNDTGASQALRVGTAQGSSGVSEGDIILNSSASNVVTFNATTTTTHFTLLTGEANTNVGEMSGWDNLMLIETANNIENGEFSSDRKWTLGDGWAIANGYATHTGSTAGSITPEDFELVAGETYILRLTTGIAEGILYFYPATAIGRKGFTSIGSGDHKYIFTATVSGSPYFYTSSTDASFTDVVIEKLENYDNWGNESVSLETAVTQYSKSNALWIDLNTELGMPIEISMDVYTTSGDTLEIGIIRAAIAETYSEDALTANPEYGLTEARIDYSISDTTSNGSDYYKQRDIVRTFNFSVDLSYDNFYKMMDSYDTNGKIPTAWKLTDIDSNNWVVFAKFSDTPSGNFDNHAIVTTSINLTEVL